MPHMLGPSGKSYAALDWGYLVQVAFNAFAELYPETSYERPDVGSILTPPQQQHIKVTTTE